MADIIDEFIVSLGLDTSEYDKEIRKYREDRKRLNEEEREHNQDTQDGQSRTVAGLRTLRNETAGFLLMLAGATSVVGFAKDMLTADAATGRFAKNVGMSTERVSVWENALKRVGGTAGEAQQALGTLFGIFQNYRLGLDASKGGALSYFGLSEMDLKDPEAALMRIAEVVKNMPREDVEAQLATLGLSGSIVGLLAGDRGELTKLLASVEAAGVANDESAEAAMTLEAQMAELAQNIQGSARPAITKLTEAFIVLTKILNNLINSKGLEMLNDLFGDGDIASIRSQAEADAAKDTPEQRALRGEFNSNFRAQSGRSNWSVRGNDTRSVSEIFGRGSGRRRPATSSRPAGRLTRAERNNNPGNIEDGPFARRQAGYMGGDGRFAKFSTAEAGFAAMENLLRGRGYVGGGRNTIAKIIAKYAPSSENNVGAYASAIERATGIDRNAVLTAAQLRSVSRAMARHEGYRGGSVDIAAGTTYAARRGPQSGRPGVGASTSPATTTVGQINVYTPATDATGIVRDIRGEMAKRGLVVQAGSGLRP